MNHLLLASAGATKKLGNTVMLLHFDGTNGSSSIIDSAVPSRSITVATVAAGVPTFTTTSKQFGTSSLFFPTPSSSSANSEFDTPASTDLVFTDDFTIEYWLTVYSTSSMRPAYRTSSYIQLNGGTYIIQDETGTKVTIGSGSSGISFGTWQHHAIVKSNGYLTLYVGGVARNTATAFGTFGNTSNPFRAINYYSGGGNSSYMDEYRVSRIARYTVNFTPPTSPFAVD